MAFRRVPRFFSPIKRLEAHLVELELRHLSCILWCKKCALTKSIMSLQSRNRLCSNASRFSCKWSSTSGGRASGDEGNWSAIPAALKPKLGAKVFSHQTFIGSFWFTVLLGFQTTSDSIKSDINLINTKNKTNKIKIIKIYQTETSDTWVTPAKHFFVWL